MATISTQSLNKEHQRWLQQFIAIELLDKNETDS